MQSFWSNTIEVSLAVHARNKDKIKKWADLGGKRVFTGPLPFDVRAQLERALAALNIKFTYVQIDLAAAGSQLESGAIDAMNIYTGGEKAPPPWLAEASLAADWAALNPARRSSPARKKFSATSEPRGLQAQRTSLRYRAASLRSLTSPARCRPTTSTRC
jgi:TRAP-type uncharacterized transport system substrate-binding protein